MLTEEEVKNSLTDDKIFLKYVQHYKNIVTLYVATKMEIWMALFMKPVFGVTGGFLSYEFASSCSAIHFHSNLYTKYEYKCEGYLNNSADDEISLSLDKYSKAKRF